MLGGHLLAQRRTCSTQIFSPTRKEARPQQSRPWQPRGARQTSHCELREASRVAQDHRRLRDLWVLGAEVLRSRWVRRRARGVRIQGRNGRSDGLALQECGAPHNERRGSRQGSHWKPLKHRPRAGTSAVCVTIGQHCVHQNHDALGLRLRQNGPQRAHVGTNKVR